MLAIINKISIGRKIVGLVTILLTIMLGIAIYNEIQEFQKRDEVTDMTKGLLPVADALARIEIHLLEQEIHYERALRMIQGGFHDEQHSKEELEKFESIGAEVAQEVIDAKEMVERNLKRLHLMDDVIELARLEPVLTQFEQEHQEYHSFALKVVAAAKSGDIAASMEMEEELEKEEDTLDILMNSMVERMTKFVEKQAHMINEHEKQRAMFAQESLLITLAAFLIGIMLSIIIAHRMTMPMRKLINSARAVARGDLDVEVISASSDEVGLLAEAFMKMTEGLKEKESIKEAFSTYVDPRIARHLMAPGTMDHEGERRNMTVFFSDIINFTSVSEQLTPKALVKLINAYLSSMSHSINVEEGVIDKFIGDAIMAYWGPPFVNEKEHAIRAVRASLDMFEHLERFQQDIPEITGLRTGAPEISIRIGIATGPVLIGNMGSDTIKNYTIMGDTVNLAARLESACKQYGIRFLISDVTRELVSNSVVTREIDMVSLKGKEEATRVFEPLGMIGTIEPAMENLLEIYAEGLEAYRRQDWSQAKKSFGAYLEKQKDDGPCMVYLDRINMLEQNSPGPEWNGVWRLTSK